MKRREFIALTGAAAISAGLPGTASGLSSILKPAHTLIRADSKYLDTIGLQVWTVRNQLAEDKEATLKAIADAGYKQVELGDPLESAEIITIAKDLGMNVTSAFLNWECLGNPREEVPDIDEVIEGIADTGIKHLVFGYIGKGHRETADHYKRHIENANAAGETCKAAGIQLCYHNHSFEFEPLEDAEGKAGFDLLIDGFDNELVKFEVDVFWVQVGGRDPIETMKQLDGRVSQVHLKDMLAETGTIYDEGQVPHEAFKELGAGVINMNTVLETAEAIGVEQCHVEQDQSPDPIASLRQSINYLTGGMGAAADDGAADGQVHWPQFRGPSGNGVVENGSHPTTWDAETNMAWSVEVPGGGWSSPVVVGDKIYLTSAVGGDKPMGFADGVRNMRAAKPDAELSFVVMCLSLADGSELWSKEVDKAIPAQPIHPSNSFATETPVTDGKFIYAYFSATGTVAALDMDGNQQWRKDVGTYETGNGFGPGSSLAIDNGRLYLQCDNDENSFLMAIDCASGDDVWKVERSTSTSWATPLVWQNVKRKEIVTLGANVVTGYNPDDGAILWSVSGVGGSFSASAASDNERIYFGNSGPASRGPLVAIPAGIEGDHELAADFTSDEAAWTVPAAGPGMSSPVVTDGRVFIPGSRGVFTCHSSEDGSEVYKTRLSGGSVAASMWAVGEHVFLLSENGSTTVIKIGDEFVVESENQIDDLFWSTPSVAGDTLLLRGVNKLYCIK